MKHIKTIILFLIINSCIQAQPECPCTITDTTTLLESDSLIDRYRYNLSECYDWRESSGIIQNYCKHSILQYLMHINQDSMSYDLRKLYRYLAEQCFEYHKRLDYPTDLCDTSIDNSPSLIMIKNNSLCLEMTNDIEEDSSIYLNKWKQHEGNYKLPDYLLIKPVGGKKQYISSIGFLGLCLAGVAGTAFVVNDPMAIPEKFVSYGKTEFSIWMLLILGAAVDILIPVTTIGSGVGSGLMYVSALKMDNRITTFDKQSKVIQVTPNIGLGVKLKY